MASHGTVAIVTGAAQGIGYAISDALLQEGYKVCLADINPEKGEESLTEFQKKYAADRIIFVQCDVSSKDSFEEVFTRTQEQFGRIDVVVNNAGIVDEYNPERMVEINIMGTVYGCDLALKFMGTKNGGQGGAVVNTSSGVGILPSPCMPVYTATKHAVLGLTRAYGNEKHFVQNGVIFMAICPYAVQTELIRSMKPLFPFSEQLLSTAVTPQFIAEGVLMLLKDRHNGSTLLSFPQGHEYVETEERFKKLMP